MSHGGGHIRLRLAEFLHRARGTDSRQRQTGKRVGIAATFQKLWTSRRWMFLPSLLLVPGTDAVFLSAVSTADGEAAGLRESTSAPPPPTWGEENDVPEAVAVPPPFRVERIFTPGAQRSTQPP